MKNLILFAFAILLAISACRKEEATLPTPDAVMVKFVNKTGADIDGLTVSRADIGFLGKGKTTAEYFRFETLGQQLGFALVEAVGTIDGKKHFTGSACQGICGTESAPLGTWLTPGYYKISIHIAEDEPNSLEFRMVE
ncbi:MAG: hypothetical protein HY842_00675 [Bacteroidetes bacterium]|nr:hypothetical protein [Bacteroidota bacterium]